MHDASNRADSRLDPRRRAVQRFAAQAPLVKQVRGDAVAMIVRHFEIVVARADPDTGATTKMLLSQLVEMRRQ